MSWGLMIMAERVPPARGGLAVATGRIAEHAAAAGQRVHVVHVTSQLEPGHAGRRARGGVNLHPVGEAPNHEEETMAGWLEHARRVAVAEQIGLVHGIYAPRAGYLAVVLGRMLGVPSVVSLRGNDLDRGLFRARELPFLRMAVERADAVTAVSATMATTAAAVFGRPVEHVTNAVDTMAFTPKGADNTLRAALGLGEAEVIGFLGELRDKKGMRYLLPALDALVRRGRDVRLLLLGGVRADARDAFEAFERIAPEAFARIHVVEYTRDPGRLSNLMGLCDVMAFPSRQDGTPNAVLEAMACARPILATDAGGQADLIHHGETGARLPVGRLDLLPEALEELLELPEAERRRMGRGARAWVEAHHRPEQEQAAYQALYARLRGASSAS
ncbi:MAG: glycosyltransferase [Myxococcales bacterium]|nr:glycosyltransferase [Myxococcales bacterium]